MAATMDEPLASQRLAGKVAVVVGGGQTPGEGLGNGRATALLFARASARVVVVDRDEASARQTVEMISASGGTALPVQADVTNPDDVAAVFATAQDAYGQVDVLHNNVGIGTGDGGIDTMEIDTWEHIFRVNLTSAMLTCKAALRLMRPRRSGAIVNVSSISAIASSNYIAYKSSKAALNAMTLQLALSQSAFGIRVNAIMPGATDTPMWSSHQSAVTGHSVERLREDKAKQVPLNERMGSAWDIAHAALYLASDEAGFVTGVILPVDGGQSARIG